MKTALSDESQRKLRNEKVITDSEFAYSIGDKYIAENILTNAKREINIPANLLESASNRRVLKG